MRRFFVPRESIEGTQVSFGPEESRHIALVLRHRPGDRIVVFDGTGAEHIAELQVIAPGHVTAQIVDTRKTAHPGLHLALLQGVPKGAKMDEVVRMGTELGVAEFIPFLSIRTVATGRGRTARWRRIAIEAAKQCRRSTVPAIHEPLPLDAALDLVAGYNLLLILWEEERQRSLADVLGAAESVSRAALIVGPEGGLEQAEVQLAVQRGAVPVTLGSLVLRTETAGVAAISMVLYELVLRRSV
jgi:16S rRNA (uracil1498-N3)-methyltransferase